MFTLREQHKKVNNNEREILNIALENLEKMTQIKGQLKHTILKDKEIDGEIDLIIGTNKIKLVVEVKSELRNYHIANLLKQLQHYGTLMVVAKRIFPKIKEELRHNNIAYLEANGNAWLQKDNIYIWIDSNEPLKQEKEKPNRAFTKTGLKVVFQFLLDEELINLPYREIANKADIGLGNVNNVLNGLKDTGYLIKLNNDEYKLTNKKELLEKWVLSYEERLKPSLEIGTFRFLKQEDFNNWKRLTLKNRKTWWGGEAAGDLYTNYLQPANLTLYTLEARNDLIKNYRLVPDTKGNVKAYKKFWQYDEINENVVPPLLAYADLMNTGDNRCTETAIQIYEQLLKDRFE